MTKVDRRILKSQEAIKKAVIELMSEKSFDAITIQDISDKANVHRATVYLHYQDKFDLLNRLIQEHIAAMREITDWACEIDWRTATQAFFEYFEQNYLFFSTMLASKGAPSFRTQFLQFIIEEFKEEIDLAGEKNRELSEAAILQYMGNAYVGVVEWWITNGMPIPPAEMAKQAGILLERTV
ncbi:TetR family transcriptional regulator [Paenibacillus sp. FSL R7-0273]|uniref:TetR/AcrR family transcriptional regulator n=1 Tax=Paenibacillus sp. FSL R7-0273 TaxID=1536772 RepID=UPI0004F8BD5E|nr:TetR/AcrR family transcriptional regulator [Paenibacillus sp. FSL R7-0273]AIQ47142.1 TetR family transcriptional regulator [Paenibacillus sp. FSL R7-0273]OMF97104.1 TetR family transcriptional regulator [Paenibacillus sp. FSL R7-0273]